MIRDEWCRACGGEILRDDRCRECGTHREDGRAVRYGQNPPMAQTVAERQRAFKASMKAAGYVKLEAWVTLEQREKFRQLGGDEWLRKKIDAVKKPTNGKPLG